MVLGTFVVIFDYPQILYFENMPPESYMMLDSETRSVHQRLLIECVIGAGIAVAGAGLLAFSQARRR